MVKDISNFENHFVPYFGNSCFFNVIDIHVLNNKNVWNKIIRVHFDHINYYASIQYDSIIISCTTTRQN